MRQPQGRTYAAQHGARANYSRAEGRLRLPRRARAWWIELSKALKEELDFVPLQLDAAFFILRDTSMRQVICMVVSHVDDLAIAHDTSSKAAVETTAKLRERFDFGGWKATKDYVPRGTRLHRHDGGGQARPGR